MARSSNSRPRSLPVIPLRLLAVLVAIAAALLSPAVADAAKVKPIKILTRSATASTNVDDGRLSATATCPKKTTALSGGFNAPADPSSHFYFVDESVRVGTRQWRVAGRAVMAPGATQSLTTQVYCARIKGKLRQGVDSTPFDSAPEASCPGKAQLLAGGFSAVPPSGDPFRLFFRNSAAFAGWTAEALGAGPTTGSLVVYAYCFKPAKVRIAKPKKASSGGAAQAAAKKKKKKTVVNPKALVQIRSSAVVPTSGSRRGTATVRCSGKLRGISGGFSLKPTVFTGFVAAIESARFAGGAWTVSAVQLSGGAGTVVARAYCG